MLPRARRLRAPGAVVAFEWPRDMPALPPAAPAPEPAAAPVFDPAEHQVRLATLEREAFAKGHAQGERSGLEAGAKRVEAMLWRLGRTLEELAALRQTMVRQTERQLVELAIAIARRILRREVTLDPDLTIAMARVALERLGDSAPATVRLHPDDHAIVVARGESWPASQVRLVADGNVSRGGCLVESDFGQIDAGPEAQIEELARALLEVEAPVDVAASHV